MPIRNGVRRSLLPMAAVIVVLMLLTGLVDASTGTPLSVADFDQSGLETAVLASFDAGGDSTLYATSDSPWGASGTLVEGDVALDNDTNIIRVMVPNSDGSLLRLNDNGGLLLREFFGQSGAGADLTVWVQTSAGTASFAANDMDKVGTNYVNFNVPASERAILTGIGRGDRFLLALTRPVPNTAATGDPRITGTAQVGETLTAGTSAIADAEGLTNVAYTYQWLADDTDITDATLSTYTLTADEEGKAIKVKVSFDDDEGNAEERTSAATDAVAAAATPDDTAPTISSVAITNDTGDDGVYGIGDKIEVTVTFSEDVTVTGSPQLELTIGSRARNAAYKSATGSKVVFSYTVASGDNDTDGIAIGANKLVLNGGGIEDNTGNSADLSHSALSTQPSHGVDGIRPTITSLTFTGSTGGSDGIYTSGEGLFASVRFNEEVIVIERRTSPLSPRQRPLLKLSVGGSNRYATFYSAFSKETAQCVEASGGTICSHSIGASRGDRLSFEYEVAEGDLDLDGVSIRANAVDLNGGTIKDAAGNDAVLTNSATDANSLFLVDAVPATIQSVTITSEPDSDNTYGCRETIEVTVTFSESVRVPNWTGSNGVQMPQLELNIGGVTRLAKTHELSTIIGTSVVFYYTVQIDDQDADGISIGANALKLNGGSIEDNSGNDVSAGEDANISHSAVAASTSHKVSTSGCSESSDESSDADASDATLSALSLTGYDTRASTSSPVDIGTFDPGTMSYTSSVAHGIRKVTVEPTLSNSAASYIIRIHGAQNAGWDWVFVGSNVITVEVTSKDGSTTKTYTVTVTRAAASTDATLSGLTLSNVDFGTFASSTTSYTASVAYSVSETTVTPTVNDSGASYVINLDGRPISLRILPFGAVPLSVGSNVFTVEVTAEDDSTTETYTVTVTRAAASTDATLSGLTLSSVDFGTFASSTTSYTAEVDSSVTETTVTPTVNDSGANYVIKLGGEEDPDGTVALAAGSNVITVEVTAEDASTTKTYTVTVTRLVTSQQNQVSSDATLSSLTLSGIDFGTFSSDTDSYTASVAYGVSQTTVTPTVNDSGATHVIKLGGVEDADGVVSLSIGSNVITVEVTAEDGETTKTYTVGVNRAAASTDATLSWLTLSGIAFGTFTSGTTSYTASVANSVSQTTVSPTVNDDGASHVIKLGGATDADGTVSLDVGSNVITVEVTAEDDSTTRTYTVTVTRAAPSPPLTASIHSEPVSHDGQAEFTFELRFSENLEGFSYSTLRDHAFTVTGGEVVKARRLESGKNIRWEIHVTPDSSVAVTIVLPATTDCEAEGAICTGDGRMLSEPLELIVSGPGG